MKKPAIFAAALLAFSVVTTTNLAHASGSDAGASAKTGEAAAYQLGKQVFAKKFACKACPLYKQRLNKTLAEQILMGKPEVQLSSAETDALAVFLQRRFKL